MPQPQFVFDRFGRVLRQELTGLGDTALTMGKNMVMEPAAGYAGLLDLMRGRGLDSAVNTIDSTQALAGGPSTREGARNLQAVSDTIGLLTEPLKRGVDVVGEYSPAGGAVLMGAGAAIDPTKLGRAGKLVKGAERTSEVARVNRRVGTTGQYVGAPAGVDSPQALGAMVNNYLAGMTEGMAGRNFYRDSSSDIYARTGRDPVQSDLLAQNIAALSRSNNVGGNTSMSAKGHIQAATGEPVITGRFPTRDSPPLQAMYDAGLVEYLGHKRDPFATQLGVAYAPERVGRGVNDMHEAELMGYPSGKVSGGAQHDFMDEVRARAIEKANAQALGGFTDWDTGTSQAAAWSGNKIRRGDINPGDAAKSYADYFPLHEANATYEAVSSPATGHLQGLLDAPFDERLAYTLDPRGSWNTSPSGRDIGYTAARMLPGETVQTVGRFKDSANPAFVARPVTGTIIGADGAKSMTPGSYSGLTAVEAARAYFDAQEAGAFHKVQPAKDAGAYSAATLDFGRPFTAADMSAVAPLFEANGYFLGSAPDGMTVMGRPAGAAYPGDPGTKLGKDFAKEVRDIIKANKGLFAGANADFGKLESNYIDYNDAWRSGTPGAVTMEMLKYMDAAPETAGLLADSRGYRDAVVARNARDTDAAAKGYGVAREDVMRARKIFAEQGWEGLRKAAAAGTVPAALLAAGGLFAAGEDTSGD
jgi:hypothetical protein